MNIEKIEQLLENYLEGKTSLEEEQTLRDYFQNEEVAEHLKSYKAQFDYSAEQREIEPDESFDAFAKIDFKDTTKSPFEGGKESDLSDSRGMTFMGNSPKSVLWSLRIAAGIIFLLLGFSAGLLVNNSDVSGQQVAALQEEINQMKGALVYGSYGATSASQRISAVNLSSSIPEDSQMLDSEITDILVYTLNNDENVNVREAAANALFRFSDQSRVRQALVNSLSKQDDPVMQMALINMLVEIKEKSAIKEMQRLLIDSDTREVVKTRLEVGIAELKV